MFQLRKCYRYNLVKLIIFLMLVLVTSTCYADTWDGDDKQLHFVAGGLAGIAGYAAHDITSPESRERAKFLTGWLLGTSVGLCKELYDQYSYGGFSYKDLVVTSAGAAVGSMIGVGIVYVDDTVFLSKSWSW